MTTLQELYYQREALIDRLYDRRIKAGGEKHKWIISEIHRLTVSIERLEIRAA